jgi:hypothetical protein
MVAPQQDTVMMRLTWGGCITAYRNLTSWMSGDYTGMYYGQTGFYRTCFHNRVPMPGFLMNVLVGDFARAYIPATVGIEVAKVYIIAEPSVINEAVAAFPDIPQILTTI